MIENFYATLRNVVGAKMVEFELLEGATMDDLLREMLRRYLPLRQELLNENGEMFAHVHIFKNGRDAPFLENDMQNSRKETRNCLLHSDRCSSI